jgi:hypothetical protein
MPRHTIIKLLKIEIKDFRKNSRKQNVTPKGKIAKITEDLK